MAKKVEYPSWIEVAPPLIISPKKTSNSPTLETIIEEDSAENCEDDVSSGVLELLEFISSL